MTETVSPAERAFERRPVFSWCLYDWANSPFPAIVLTFVMPAYFAQGVVKDAAVATSQWAFMTGAAALVIAFASPILGSIADLLSTAALAGAGLLGATWRGVGLVLHDLLAGSPVTLIAFAATLVAINLLLWRMLRPRLKAPASSE